MASLKWCCNQKDGIKLIEPNENLASSYMKMAEDAIGTMNREKDYNLVFAVSACYYSMYYSLYSVMMEIGVKCEIHSCSLEFMRLLDFYSKEDIKVINKAFGLRNTIQYYVDKIVEREDINFIIMQAPFFLNKSKNILSRINETDIENIRRKIQEVMQS